MTSNNFEDMFFFSDDNLSVDEDTKVTTILMDANQCICCAQNDYCVY
jgi:hypothetical protein